jgi:hypothetical protein
MSNYNVPTNATGHDEEEYDEDGNLRAACIALVLILIMLTCIISAAGILGRARLHQTLELSAPAAERQKEKDEKREQRKKWISEKLIVREWSLDEATAETKTSGKKLTTADEHVMPESAPQTRDRISCELGTDDYESFLEEASGCAICLSHFKSHQLVCESNNLSCGHVFHQDCMMDWLMKHRMCPLCREVYLLKTVSREDRTIIEI